MIWIALLAVTCVGLVAHGLYSTWLASIDESDTDGGENG